MYHFATLFNINYLSRGLALLSSLTEQSSQDFNLFILALDEDVAQHFEKIPHPSVTIIRLGEMETFYPELLEAKGNRSTIEYFFTLSPYLPLYILKKHNVGQITSMDADLYFFDDPALIFNQYPQASVLITPHSFIPALTYLEKYGRYNVSFQSFKNDSAALACLEDWRHKCLNWCYDDYDEANDRFADQKYLDSWAKSFDNVQELNIPGAGTAPWNVMKYKLEVAGKKIMVDNSPLIFYHFHHLRVFSTWFAVNGLENYLANPDLTEIKYLYHIYLKKLKEFSNSTRGAKLKPLRDKKILSENLLERFKTPQGYWLFTSLFIWHINPYQRYNQIKRTLSRLWPS